MAISFPSSPATNDTYSYGGVTWTWNGSVWIVGSYGSAGPTGPVAPSTEIEIDFGTVPVRTKSFTITDATVSSSSHIHVSPSGKIATGRIGNDAAWDSLILTATPGTGSFVLTAMAIPGPVKGKRKVIYQVGT